LKKKAVIHFFVILRFLFQFLVKVKKVGMKKFLASETKKNHTYREI